MKILINFKNALIGPRNTKFRKIKLLMCGILFLFSFMTIGYRTISLAGINKSSPANISFKTIKTDISENLPRGNIYDRNKELLATTISTSSLNINPQEVLNKKNTIKKLIEIFPQLDEAALKTKLYSKKQFVNILREISPKEHVLLLNEGIEGLKIRTKHKRIYPNNNLAAHILGSTDIDGSGIAGIEKSSDNQLKNGKNIKISIHSGIQHITEKILFEQINKFEAEGGAGIVMNSKNGEIYAITSLPDYNVNNYNKVSNELLFNKATKGIYELGSTLKLITAAIALDSGLIKENEVFDVSRPLRVSSRTIRDFHPLNYAINIPEVIVHSSNIGSAKIAEKFGSETQLKYLRKLGFMNKMNLQIPELGTPQVLMDRKLLSTMTISYGHGIAITPLHLATSTATLVNNGIKVNPTLLVSKTREKHTRVFSKSTSNKIKSIMRLVVKSKYGTAKKAEAKGYLIGGKTGTAEKLSKTGGYLKKQNIVAFTSAFPINNPQFIITVMIDNPKGQKFSYGYRTAGWVVAPVVKRLVTRIAPILNIKPQNENSLNFSQNLIQYEIRGKEKGANL
ncbi:penicillin-binding protein 2 [Alphaproteobacteria bacterium]|nr:penicillin-binding protein 2 [Alphaproteobacteria bacterium]